MTPGVFDLQASYKPSRVLADWSSARALTRATIKAASENTTATNLTADELVEVLSIGNTTASGVRVSPESGHRHHDVYACVGLIIGAISTLPLQTYERKGKDRDESDHPYWWMLNERANDTMSAATAWECLVGGKLLYGDGYGELIRPSRWSNRVIGWEPHHPLRISTFWGDEKRRERYHRVVRVDGTVDVLDDADMIQLPSQGFDGLHSPSPITFAAREAIGSAIAAQHYSANFFAEGATFDYALKTAMDLKAPQIQALRDSLIARVRNNERGKRSPLILTGGLEPANLSITPRDSEILGVMNMNTAQIARVFQVPPFLIGHTEKVTSWGSGIQQMGMGFVRYTLQRILTAIAQEFNYKLWPTRERYFVEHDTTAFEKGDMKSRFEGYRIAIGRAGEQPWMSVDEIRRREKMRPGENLPAPVGATQPAADPDPTDPTDPAKDTKDPDADPDAEPTDPAAE